MKHARDDHNRIQDPAGIIPEDEPVFLLRGQDVSAPFALEHWAYHHQRRGGDMRLAELAVQQAALMRAWQREHGSKVADLPDTKPSP